MKEIIVQKNDAGQRLDKMLAKYLNQASTGFIYKMLRKKNIKLNGKKATGNELLQLSDHIEIFLSDETFEKFSTVKISNSKDPAAKNEPPSAISADAPYKGVKPVSKSWIIYEDSNVCLINKPQGFLSQKATVKDVSVNEMFISYLLKTNQLTAEELQTFHPSICNRLDRNTSGLLIAGKSLKGLQEMAKILQTREVHKYYWCVVKGCIEQPQRINGYLLKDEKTNKVSILSEKHPDAKPIITEYHPIASGKDVTLLEVLLVTGRTHQIRAHLSSIGHPILGDLKYGDYRINDLLWKKYKIKNQMLHARRVEFPQLCAELQELSDKSFEAPLPEVFQKFISEEFVCQPGNHVD